MLLQGSRALFYGYAVAQWPQQSGCSGSSCSAGRVLRPAQNSSWLLAGIGSLGCGHWCTCSFSQNIVQLEGNAAVWDEGFGDGRSICNAAFPSRVAAGIQPSCPEQLKG